MGKKKLEVIKSHTLVETSDKNIFRLANRKGDWKMYYDDRSKTYMWAVSHILDVGYNKGLGFVIWLLSKTAEEAKQILEDTGNRGTRVHMAVANLVMGNSIKLLDDVYIDRVTGHGKKLTDEEWNFLQSFVQFVEDYKPISISLEQTIGSTKLGWAGTYDWVCTLELTDKIGIGKNAKFKKRRVRVLVDFKTSSAIHDAYNMQLAAYWLILKERKQTSGLHTAVLRLGTKHKCGYEFKLWTPKQTVYHAKVFKAIKVIHEFKEGLPEPTIKEFPAEISVEIPTVKIIKTKKKTK